MENKYKALLTQHGLENFNGAWRKPYECPIDKIHTTPVLIVRDVYSDCPNWNYYGKGTFYAPTYSGQRDTLQLALDTYCPVKLLSLQLCIKHDLTKSSVHSDIYRSHGLTEENMDHPGYLVVHIGPYNITWCWMVKGKSQASGGSTTLAKALENYVPTVEQLCLKHNLKKNDNGVWCFLDTNSLDRSSDKKDIFVQPNGSWMSTIKSSNVSEIFGNRPALREHLEKHFPVEDIDTPINKDQFDNECRRLGLVLNIPLAHYVVYFWAFKQQRHNEVGFSIWHNPGHETFSWEVNPGKCTTLKTLTIRQLRALVLEQAAKRDSYI